MNSTIEYVTNFNDQFCYCKETDCIVAEISSLGKGVDLKGVITIVSEKTGKSVDYRYAHTDYCGEGEDREIGGWYFKPVDQAVKTRMLIIND